jgi:citronellol/citronellal dehydrogenase
VGEPGPGEEPLGAGPSRIFGDGALEGQVALVTGGGTNLGKAAAVELARCGASVLIAGRREDVLAETAATIGERCSWVSGDIRERADAERIVRTALERHGCLDFVLNNAGGQYFVPAEGITIKGWRAVQRLNVGGTLAMCHAAYELAMRPAGAGTIVNVTVSPHHGMPAMAHTGAARAAVEALTRELAAAWAADGVSVAAVAIGRFATESLRKYPAELWKTAAATVPTPAPRRRRGVRLARGPARLARRTVVLGLRHLDRRRRRQLERPVAASRPRRRGRDPDRGAPPRRALTLPGARGYHRARSARGRSVVVAQEPSKLRGRVRFPSPALRCFREPPGGH